MVPPRRRPQVARAVPGDLRPHDRRHAGARRDHARRGRMRRGPRRRRRRLCRGPHGARAVHRPRPHPRRGPGGDPGRLRDRGGARRRGRPSDRRPLHRDRDAPGRALGRGRRMRRPLAGRGRRRVRYRRPGGRLSADPPPRRLRIRPARELPHHHPRRRVLRAALDLGGAPVLRRRAAGPRRPHRRRHHGPRRRLRRTRAAGCLRARPARPARDVPDLERPHRGGAVDRGAPHRPAPPPALPRHPQHRQPADERRLALERVRGARRRIRDRARRDGVADHQRAEERVHAVRRAAPSHQRGRQARATRTCAPRPSRVVVGG